MLKLSREPHIRIDEGKTNNAIKICGATFLPVPIDLAKKTFLHPMMSLRMQQIEKNFL
jgi:hypothetical protein